MVSKSSVHTIQHLIDGAQGVGLIALTSEFRVNCATPLAVQFFGLIEPVETLPDSLLLRLRNTLDAGGTRFTWTSSLSGQPHSLEILLSHITLSPDLPPGHALLILDATNKISAEEQLRKSNTILTALRHFDWQMQSAANWQTALPQSIEMIGQATGFTRIGVFRNLMSGDHTARLTLVHQWNASDGPPTAADIAGEFTPSTRWIQLLQQGEPVFGNVMDLPATEQNLLFRRNVEAMALMPIFVDNAWWGAISFERSGQGTRILPDEISDLVAVGRSLGMAIQRQLTAERLTQAKIAFDSTAEGIMICDAKKRITAVNKGFTEITGYTDSEAIGRTPEILNSGKNSPEFYATMWRSINQDGVWRGEILNRRKNGEIYPQWLTITSAKAPNGQVTHYVAVFADVSEAKASQQRLHQLANHDPLTGLPNRRLLNELLERALKHSDRKSRTIGLLFVDLDRFKTINDTLGHHAGDQLLSSVTRRLIAAVRDCDTVSRLSGDEFIIMMDSLKRPEDAAIVANKVIAALQESFIIDGNELFIGASIGISLYPQDGLNANDLIKAADIAMYQAKHEGRNGFRYYTSQLGESAHERLNLDTMLRHALERDQLVVYYQPQISLESGRIIGAEALVRWQHPKHGMVPPGKFIPLAEETGLIIPIGEWVLRQAASDAMRLHAAACPLQWISVNVSAAQLHRSSFADTVYGVLIETGCEPEQLELEITESAIMNSVDYVIEVCRNLKDMGVKLALDDFGTGYSSLSYLKRFPLDKLKIDQSFVRELPHDAEDIAISSAIIGLGHNLGLTVIAEGVEKTDQETFLRNKGCQEAQGFLYSRPVPFTVLLELLATQKAATP